MFAAVGHHGMRMSSDDGLRWSDPQLGKEGEVYRGLCYGAGRFVAYGSFGGLNLFAATTDGKNWQTASQDAKYSRYIRGLAFGEGRFLALGGDAVSVGAANAFSLHSTDGLTWSAPHESGAKYVLRRAAFGNGRWVGVGDRGRRSVSTDGGVTWEDVPKPRAVDTLIDVAFGKEMFVGVGLHGLRMATRDGKTWSERQVGEEGEHCNNVLWTGEQFVAVGQGATYFSADGEKWQRVPNRNAPTTAAYGGGLFVGSSWKGRISTSTDGIVWKEVHKCEHHVEAFAFGSLG